MEGTLDRVERSSVIRHDLVHLLQGRGHGLAMLLRDACPGDPATHFFEHGGDWAAVEEDEVTLPPVVELRILDLCSFSWKLLGNEIAPEESQDVLVKWQRPQPMVSISLTHGTILHIGVHDMLPVFYLPSFLE